MTPEQWATHVIARTKAPKTHFAFLVMCFDQCARAAEQGGFQLAKDERRLANVRAALNRPRKPSKRSKAFTHSFHAIGTSHAEPLHADEEQGEEGEGSDGVQADIPGSGASVRGDG